MNKEVEAMIVEDIGNSPLTRVDVEFLNKWIGDVEKDIEVELSPEYYDKLSVLVNILDKYALTRIMPIDRMALELAANGITLEYMESILERFDNANKPITFSIPDDTKLARLMRVIRQYNKEGLIDELIASSDTSNK